MNKYQKKEKLLNAPNLITLVRVILTFVLIYMFLKNFEVVPILIVFVIAALTDFLDGQVARRFNKVTFFGAKFDIVADRFLWITSGLLILITFYLRGIFSNYHMALMILSLTREFLCLPFVFMGLILKRKIFFQAESSGKITTFMQGFAFPLIILHSLGYILLEFSLYFAIFTAISGIWAAKDYGYKVIKNSSN
jgi:phosphatidylglycerophosphate synthase